MMISTSTATANGVPVTAGTGINLDADTLLQASRRLDWRFLLPDPTLGRVGYLGTPPAALRDSLQLFSESLTILTLAEARSAPAGQYDLVVVRQASVDTLHLAARHVRSRGYLYVENEGLLSPKRPRPPWKHWRMALPNSCATAAARAGFTDIHAYWHWPNFASCTQIIPLDDRGALRHAFVRGGRSAKARLQSVAGRGLLWSGLLARIVPRFSIVARLES